MSGYTIAKQYIGLQEVRDNEELKKILASEGSDVAVDPAKTAWCASFINVCERKAGNKGTGALNARSFVSYGDKVASIGDAEEGDIVVFSRGDNSWEGHVAYFVSYDSDTKLITCLGGNQSDSVCLTHEPLSHLLAIRRSGSEE